MAASLSSTRYTSGRPGGRPAPDARSCSGSWPSSACAGFSSITLWVLRDNRRARRFYERAGFAPDGATHVLTRLGDVPELRYRRTLQL